MSALRTLSRPHEVVVRPSLRVAESVYTGENHSMTYSGKLLFGATVNYSLVVVMWLVLYLPVRESVPTSAFWISLLILVAVGVIAFYRAASAVKGLAQPLERVTESLEAISRG